MHYDYFQNSECEYFPCHEADDAADFNCLFCYCPLYALGRACGGNFSYGNRAGIKDCSGCLLPHRRANYTYVTQKLAELIERVKENPQDGGTENA